MFYLIKLNEQTPVATPTLFDNWFDQANFIKSRKTVKYYEIIDLDYTIRLELLMMTPRTDFSKETDSFIEGYSIDSTTLAIQFIKKWQKSDFDTTSFSLSDMYSIGRNIYLLDLEQVIRF